MLLVNNLKYYSLIHSVLLYEKIMTVLKTHRLRIFYIPLLHFYSLYNTVYPPALLYINVTTPLMRR